MPQHRRGAGSLPVCALMCALMCVCAQIQIPLPGVPVNLALFAVHLSAMLLGAGRSLFVVTAYLLLGLCGVPVFAGFASGPAALFGPTGGFLLGYLLCALLTGALARRFGRSFFTFFLCALPGTTLCMVVGFLWFMVTAGIEPSPQLFAYWLLFLPGDLCKIAFAALLALRLQKAFKTMGIK